MKKNSWVFIAGMVIAWAGFYLASKWCVSTTDSPYLAGMLLRITAFIFLTGYMLLKGNFKELFKIKNCWFMLLIIGILGFLLDLFANIGFQHSSVATGTALLKTDILMANIVGAIILKERLTKLDWLCTIIMLVGVVLALGIDFTEFHFNWYDLFFIFSAMAVTANAFLIKSTQIKYNVSNDVIAYYNNVVVLIVFTIAALITKDMGKLANVNINSSFVTIVILGGIAQSFLYIFYYRNLREYPVWLVKVFLLLVPIISSIVGILVFKEELSATKIIGIVTVLSGAAGIILLQKRKLKVKGELK
jgi:drug/metabolite transporter (DMT)-like permease